MGKERFCFGSHGTFCVPWACTGTDPERAHGRKILPWLLRKAEGCRRLDQSRDRTGVPKRRSVAWGGVMERSRSSDEWQVTSLNPSRDRKGAVPDQSRDRMERPLNPKKQIPRLAALARDDAIIGNR